MLHEPLADPDRDQPGEEERDIGQGHPREGHVRPREGRERRRGDSRRRSERPPSDPPDDGDREDPADDRDRDRREVGHTQERVGDAHQEREGRWGIRDDHGVETADPPGEDAPEAGDGVDPLVELDEAEPPQSRDPDGGPDEREAAMAARARRRSEPRRVIVSPPHSKRWSDDRNAREGRFHVKRFEPVDRRRGGAVASMLGPISIPMTPPRGSQDGPSLHRPADARACHASPTPGASGTAASDPASPGSDRPLEALRGRDRCARRRVKNWDASTPPSTWTMSRPSTGPAAA